MWAMCTEQGNLQEPSPDSQNRSSGEFAPSGLHGDSWLRTFVSQNVTRAPRHEVNSFASSLRCISQDPMVARDTAPI